MQRKWKTVTGTSMLEDLQGCVYDYHAGDDLAIQLAPCEALSTGIHKYLVGSTVRRHFGQTIT